MSTDRSIRPLFDASNLRGGRAHIIGNGPEHKSALRYKAALEGRDVAVTFQSMAEALAEVRCSDNSNLLDFAQRDPYALQISVDDLDFFTTAQVLNDVSFVVLVTNDFGPYATLLSQLIDRKGIEQLNNDEAFVAANDKWLTHICLRDSGVPTPRGVLVHDIAEAKSAASELGYPLVVKELRGTQGNGVRLVVDELSLVAQCSGLEIERQPLLIEHYIECASSDKRILMMNGHFVAAMERHAKSGDFRANISLGGTAEACDVSLQEIEVTRSACSAIGLRLIGADIATVSRVLPGREYLPLGSAFCIEANAMPALADLAEIAHLDCAEKVIELLFKEVP